MTLESGAGGFVVPEPNSVGFMPEVHCGLEPSEQNFYDHVVAGALAEVDKSIQTIESTLINSV
jgi:hypothetical protein